MRSPLDLGPAGLDGGRNLGEQLRYRQPGEPISSPVARSSRANIPKHNELRAEFLAIIRPYRVGDVEDLADVAAQLPHAEQKRAAEIWQRIEPAFELRRRDQSS